MKLINLIPFLFLYCVNSIKFRTETYLTEYNNPINDCLITDDLYIGKGDCLLKSIEKFPHSKVYIYDTFSNLPNKFLEDPVFNYQKSYNFQNLDNQKKHIKILTLEGEFTKENIEPFLDKVEKINNDEFGYQIPMEQIIGLKNSFYRALI